MAKKAQFNCSLRARVWNPMLTIYPYKQGRRGEVEVAGRPCYFLEARVVL